MYSPKKQAIMVTTGIIVSYLGLALLWRLPGVLIDIVSDLLFGGVIILAITLGAVHYHEAKHPHQDDPDQTDTPDSSS